MGLVPCQKKHGLPFTHFLVWRFVKIMAVLVFTLNFAVRNHGQAGISGAVSRSDYIDHVFTKAAKAAKACSPSLVKGFVFSNDIRNIKELTGLDPAELEPVSDKRPGLFYARYIVPSPDAVDVGTCILSKTLSFCPKCESINHANP